MRVTAFAAATLLLAACADHGPLTPVASEAGADARAGSDLGAAQEAIDVSGSWTQQSELFIHLADWAAGMFGIVPEGTRTTLRCELAGTLSISQSGTELSGTYTESGPCSTPGGQQIHLSESGTLQGSLRGRSVEYVLVGHPGPVECPQRGAVSRVENGTAVEMQGNGHCIEPGHPQSAVQVPLRRAGPNRTRWTAERI